MALIGTLVSFSPSTTISSSDVNSNFSDIRTAFNNTACLTDVARTITVTNVYSVAQTFSLGLTITAGGATVTAGGVTITAGGLAVGTSLATNIAVSVQPVAGANATQYGGFWAPTFPSTSTDGRTLGVQLKTAASSFTLTSGYGLLVLDASKGAGSTITTQYGLYVSPQAQGGTNYGIYIDQAAVTGNALRISQASAVTDDAVKILAGSVTGSSAPSLINLTQTWNTSGGPSAIKVNVTNTSSTDARLLNLQVASAEKVTVDVNGAVMAGVGTAVGTFRVAQCLFQNPRVTTTSTAITTCTSFSVPAGSLAANGQSIRVSFGGIAATASCTFSLLWGGTSVVTVTAATGGVATVEAVISRYTGTGTQTAVSRTVTGSTPSVAVSDALAEDSSVDVPLSFRAATNAGGTAAIVGINVEYVSD